MAKPRIAVFFGGVSSEHEISLKSAATVIRNIPQEKYEVICVGITKKGRWLYYPGPVDLIPSGEWEKDPDCCNAILSPDRTHHGLLKLLDGGESVRLPVDVLFPVLHGKNGEDGTIQGLFELSGIPYVGCGVSASANCMDKAITHSILQQAGIVTAPWEVVSHADASRLEERCAEIAEALGFPLFVKPARAGSSVGINKVTNVEELRAAVRFAFTHDRKVVVEQELIGSEIECAVLGNEAPQASMCGEIVPCNEFYDYEAKYLRADSELRIPARLSDETMLKARRLAVKAYRAMGCEGLARVDCFVTPDEEVIVNEINTLPGFTNISMYPMLWEKAGLPLPDLLETLIDYALRRSDA